MGEVADEGGQSAYIRADEIFREAGTKTSKIIASKITPEVWLRSGTATWSNLSLPLKRDLLAGLERIADLRRDIAIHAKIQTMPPVEIVSEIWATDTGTIDGRAGIVRYQGTMTLGAQLPALTAMCADERAVRRILVHEFSHCFHNALIAVDTASRGGQVVELPEYDPFNANEDAMRLGTPGDWFGDDDVASMALHDDAGLSSVQKRFIELRPFFHVLVPALKFRESIVIETEMRAHAEKLIARRRTDRGAN